ncbi:MAG TPA: cob(I)yrinic acid a,c-diamide adenosyltransferase [Sandaracinaceae bacterium LLY-WYZ-13_1]|nr:cob(I)yrinic acid a,c-diamide adenosyltransferase [Sandaracinaceae bacterium LLY-WYZ-13_1]
MKIYTKTGDEGETGLFGGTRVSKASDRVWAYGDVDELNSVIGLARLHPIDDERDALLARIQSELFDLGAELAARPGKDPGVPKVGEAQVGVLEEAIDGAEAELEPLKSFVLPGGGPAAAQLHHARTVCRRAERRVVGLGRTDEVRPEVIRYLNRLSDLLFVLARLANHRAGVPDVPWVGRGAGGAS